MSDCPLISLCTIVRNEERHLARCLESVRDLVDEIVVTDTGSTDGTLDIARRFGAVIQEIEWPNSFAEARTRSVQPARGDWIFYLDADEFLDEPNRARLRDLRARLAPLHVYLMRQVSPAPGGNVFEADQPRLFPRLDGLRWTFRVHEQVLGFLREHGCKVVPTAIRIQHSGFEGTSSREQKLARNLALLLDDLRDHPENGFVWFNRAACHLDRSEFEEAALCLDRAIALAPARAPIVAKARVLLIVANRRAGRLSDALAHANAAFEHDPENAEVHLERAAVLEALDRPADAIASLERVLAAKPGGVALGPSPEILKAHAHARLARLRKSLGR